jgi:PPE-repeat protein
MFAGAGSGPMLEAAAAWEGLADELGSAASSFGSVTSGLSAQAWQGPASAAMAGYHGGVSTAAAQLSPWAQAAQALFGAEISTPNNVGNGNVGAGNHGNGNLGSGKATPAASTRVISSRASRTRKSAWPRRPVRSAPSVVGGKFGRT